jgi:hypothetical protein
MKKIFLLTFILLCSACSFSKEDNTTSTNIEKEKTNYIKYVQKLEKIEESSEDMPFDINVKYDKLTDDEIRYQVVIDNPKGDVTDIKALAIHDKQTDDVFPSVGIFEEKMSLIPNEKPEGIILVGYVPYTKSLKSFEIEIKVMVSYTYENEKHTSYYVTKK